MEATVTISLEEYERFKEIAAKQTKVFVTRSETTHYGYSSWPRITRVELDACGLPDFYKEIRDERMKALEEEIRILKNDIMDYTAEIQRRRRKKWAFFQ